MELHCLRRMVPALAGIGLGLVLGACGKGGGSAGGFETVQGPGADPSCFRPSGKTTPYYQWKKKPGPYRIALDNGFIGNTWRIQMIKTAKAYADQPAIKSKLKEFKVISTGEDLPAQIAAANNLIDAGYDAVIVNALNPAAFAPVAKKAKKAGVVLLSFDNVIESSDNVVVNVDQVELGRLIGKWDDGTAQKATADAIAIHKKFDGIYVQGGSTGTVRALLDAKHPMIPISGETENGFRKLCGANAGKGLHCSSAGTGPAQVAVTIKAAIA